LPCLAWAQYPSNGNQKITLGEQTTADGLIYRGVAATDTVRKPSIDTMAYMVLDTTTNIIWHYKKATSNAWLRLNLLPSDTASFNYVNTYGTQTVNGAKTFTSAVTATRFNPTANTATGTGMYLPKTNTIGFTTNTTTRFIIAPRGISIFKSDSIQNLFSSPMIEIGAQGMIYSASGSTGRFNDYTFGMGFYFDASGNQRYMATTDGSITHQPVKIAFYQGSIIFDNAVGGNKDSLLTFVTRMKLDENGNLGIGETSPTQKLHVVGNARITAMNGIGDIGADANGVLQAATSDMNLKNTIENSPFGLNEILLLNPVTFLYNDTNRKIDSDVKEVGFIAQDVFDIIPNAVSSTGTGDLQLDYRAITATLVKAIQEQNLLIKALEQRIINLENK
jgi:hypothetical protein